MGRRNESPEKKRRRELIGEFLKDNPLRGMNDINELVKELIEYSGVSYATCPVLGNH